MRKLVLSIFVLAGLVGCASPSATKSQYNLGVDSFKSKDYVAARFHWQAAVQANEPLAMNNLGYLLYNGLGGPVEVDLAMGHLVQMSLRVASEQQSVQLAHGTVHGGFTVFENSYREGIGVACRGTTSI